MKYLLLFLGGVIPLLGSTQINVYDYCVDPSVTQADINGSGYEYTAQCVVFEDNVNYQNGQSDHKKITATKSIHIEPKSSTTNEFHWGPFNTGNHGWLNIDHDRPFEVYAMDYSELGNILKYERFELGLDLPTAINDKVNNFINNTGTEKLNPYVDWDLRVYAEFNHPSLSQPILVDGFYYQEFTSHMLTIQDIENNFGTGPMWLDNCQYPSLGGYTKNNTAQNFRIRFSPPELGLWTCIVHIETNTSVVSSSPFKFNVIESGNPGYLSPGDNNRFFELDNSTFFPVGCNITWPRTMQEYDPEFAKYSINSLGDFNEEDYRNYAIVPRVYDKFRELMSLLSGNGVNFMRMIMYPSGTDIEWEKAGDYTDRLSMAQELDEILEHAESEDVYLLWNLQIHYSFGPYGPDNYHKEWCWDNISFLGSSSCWQFPYEFCYKTLTGSNDPLTFFTDSNAKDYYKQRLRYILARWGYSTNIGLFELISEVNNSGAKVPFGGDMVRPYTIGTEWVKFRNWQVEMGNYINSHYNGKTHMLTTSYGGAKHTDDDTFSTPNSPFNVMSSNMYDFSYPDGSKFWIDHVNRRQLNDLNIPDSYVYQNGIRNVKPMIYSENGGDESGEQCASEVQIKRLIWQSAFSGLAGAFDWSNRFHPNNLDVYSQVKEFTSNIEFDKDHWHPGAVFQVHTLSPPVWFYSNPNAALMYKSTINQQNKEVMGDVDLSYLRSGNNASAMGVITNFTYNVVSASNCPYVDTLIPTIPQTAIAVSPTSEGLALRGMMDGNYVVNYYSSSNVSGPPILSKTVTASNFILPLPKFWIQPTDDQYIVPFKAYRIASKSSENGENTVISKAPKIIIHPVPAKNTVNITSTRDELLIVHVASMEGKIVGSFDLKNTSYELDISTYESGVYLTHFYNQNDELIDSQKFVKL